MKVIETSAPDALQQEAIRELWNNEYPGQLNHSDTGSFRNYLQQLSEQKHFLLVDDNDSVRGWAFVFVRDREKWFAIIVDSRWQGSGCGKLLLNKLKENATKLSGWVIDHSNDKKGSGENYLSPLAFYLKHGFVVCADTRLERDKISAVKIEWPA